MEDNKIKFEITNNQVTMKITNPIPMDDFLTVVFTGILGQLKAVVAATPEEHKVTTTEELYDMLNAAASNTLSYFAPDIEMRPHLTTQAILDAENAIIERQYQAAKRQSKTITPDGIPAYTHTSDFNQTDTINQTEIDELASRRAELFGK